MHFQYFFTPFKIGKFYRDSPVKTSRAQKRRIQCVRSVCCRKYYNTFRRIKTVHFCKELIQCLLPFIISCHSVAVTFLADRIDLIDKYNTRGFLICLFKQITHF